MTKLYNEAIEFLREISQNINDSYEKDIEEIENLLNDDSYKIAVIGEFSVGKSTFLNSIIGKRVLYSSAQEATGVLTTIRNSEEKRAYIDNNRDGIDLSGENSYLELKSYLDRNRNDYKNIENVSINYPMMGIDKDVLLMDTPGLQGIREKELLITKDALKEANATIVIIDHKGLTGTELSLLQGNLKEFGRIKTKEIILIVNKIGELYSNRSNEEALIKIRRVIESVKNTLEENNLSNVKVFALDSRDYLWGRDMTLFKEVLKENDSNINELLTQEMYLQRSGFNEFKEYLHNFLNKENRAKAFYEDIKERILILLDAFKEELQKNETKGVKDTNNILNKINIQKDLINENRRAIINSTRRQLMESLEEFTRVLELDINDEVINGKQKVLLYIKDKIKCYDDLNSETKKNLANYIQVIVNNSINTYSDNVNKYKSNINVLLNDTFNKQFQKTFNENGKIDFNVKENEVEISLEYKDTVEDNILTDLEISIIKSEEELKKNRHSLKEYTRNYSKEVQQLEAQIRVNKVEKQNDISRLGPRPEPVQKYKTETRTRRKWVIFTEDYSVKVADGLDYSKVLAWDNNSDVIGDKYRKIEKRYQNDIDKLDKEKVDADSLNKRILRLEAQIKNLKATKNSAIEKRAKLIEDKKEMFFESKREELYIIFSELLNKYLRQGLNKLKKVLVDYSKQTNDEVSKQANQYLDTFKETLEEKYKQAIEDIKDLKIDKDDTLDKLINMEKKLNGKTN